MAGTVSALTAQLNMAPSATTSTPTATELEQASKHFLPTELVQQILSSLPSRTLCALAPSCPQICASVDQILTRRLRDQMSDSGFHHLVFEIYQSHDKSSAPYHMVIYSHTAREGGVEEFGTPMVSVFRFGTTPPNSPGHGTRYAQREGERATYVLTVESGKEASEISCNGTLVKMSDKRPGMFAGVQDCFGMGLPMSRGKLEEEMREVRFLELGEGVVLHYKVVGREVVMESAPSSEESLESRMSGDNIGDSGASAANVNTDIDNSVSYTIELLAIHIPTAILLKKLDMFESQSRSNLSLVIGGTGVPVPPLPQQA
ncbi:hypothetical protein G7K_5290-t1 [Saitoella complicata NRRL Y-17804]|uniref:F-box domain-containing protein n=1 Tax=Saitoella complicata (strain BCRC 22490 / CBS 7301 / JCM 7358 / NBRC 10748 / NRRL Y-17804) TaxID=698492 RepID=A0A0E9NMW5_SAICN|nr:hypothetical protein G7K_5290-t1 [Saitoella complicata NRRL Y-17804]